MNSSTVFLEFLSNLSEDRRVVLEQMISVIREHIPEGFEEAMQYGMPSWVVPHSLYPPGYHTKPETPLPFLSIGSKKNYVTLHHMGIYADDDLLAWFENAYPRHVKTKLNMGKSCIRFKKMTDVPYELIGELCGKVTVEDWIQLYENRVK